MQDDNYCSTLLMLLFADPRHRFAHSSIDEAPPQAASAQRDAVDAEHGQARRGAKGPVSLWSFQRCPAFDVGGTQKGHAI
jgi:hypothetical protein